MSTTVHAKVLQERDRFALLPVHAAAAVLTALLAAGAFVTWLNVRHAPSQIGERRDQPATVVPREIQGIDQTLFSSHLPSRGDREARQRALDGFSWVDRERGIATIPVQRAMELLVERQHAQ